MGHSAAAGLKSELDRLYKKYNTPEFILKDPVQFPHRYKNRFDRETAAFLAATIAWGKREMILKSAEKMFSLLGASPYDFVIKGNYKKLSSSKNIHRTFFEGDLAYFCRGLRACYKNFGSIEALFASAGDLWEGIGLFRETMAGANGGLYSKHVSSPESGSACKRLHLALRWLVRREGPVDLGLWKKAAPADLYIPLDVHVGRSARQLGLLGGGRKANDKKSVIVITEKLRELCPQDPVKYDLALFGYSGEVVDCMRRVHTEGMCPETNTLPKQQPLGC